ncbi:MAG: hypothetical protein RRX92_02145 [Lachnospiraceae bacterium]
MDNFMDKLAQKWNAGELIKANSAAEAKELRRLQEQVSEYEDILQEMRKVNLKNVELVESSQKLIEEGIKETASIIEAVKQGDGSQEQIQQQLITAIANKSEELVHIENVKVYRNVQASTIEALAAQTAELTKQNQALHKSNITIMIVLIITLLLSAGNIGIQVLQMMGVL